MRECDEIIRKLESEKQKIHKEIETKNKELDEKTQEALKHGERVNTTRTPEEIQSELVGRENFYKKNLNLINSKGTVYRLAKKLDKDANEIKGQIQFVQKILGVSTI